MKTLDEVINIFEKACDLERRCEDCSGCLDQEAGCPNDGADAVPDALHYLKHLQEYYAMTREHHEPNPALTWDELKKMEGKPAWVECKFYSHQWAIIGEVTENRIRFYGPRLVDGEPQEEMGKIWQAYRKERE